MHPAFVFLVKPMLILIKAPLFVMELHALLPKKMARKKKPKEQFCAVLKSPLA